MDVFIKTKMAFKSIKEISVNEISLNKFEMNNLSEPIQPNLRVPINGFFGAINFNYETDLTLHRKSNWFNHVILFLLISNILRNLVYTFMNSTDQLFRLFCGDLIQFAVKEVSYMAITFVGITSYATAMFCLFHYSEVNQLKWLNIFDAIEGKQSFIESKILITKSAKKLIRFSLFLFNLCISSCLLIPTVCAISFVILPFQKLSFEHFFLYALPWNIFTVFWAIYTKGYPFASLFITIICYYYQLRLNQVDVYVNWLLKQKRFQKFNQRIMKVLNEYIEIMTEVNQFNKFASKVLFFLFVFNASTIVFILYNLIYVKLTAIAMLGHYVVVIDILFVITIIILNAIRIPNQFNRNKRNLKLLIYKKNLQIKTQIKVSFQ